MLKQYTTSLPDGTAVHWRPLTWGEYRKLTSALEIEEGPAIWHLYDAVAGLCITEFECPIADDYDDLPAGIIECIGELILAETGFIPTRDLVQKQIDEARGRIQKDYYHTGVAYICTAFHLKPKEVDELTIDEFMDYLAMAEVALGADISIPDPEKANETQYMEMPDPKTGKIMKVPIAKRKGKQSKVEISDGRRR
jgi:hypothetical protein